MTLKYSALWNEALAYHEAGHVVMSLVLDVLVARVVIAESCNEPGFIGPLKEEAGMTSCL